MNNEERKQERDSSASTSAQETTKEAPSVAKGSMSVFLYILLLFSAALLLMGLSSLIHQRNNTEALGKLQNSVSIMQEVQNLQEKIISLQEARQELEEQLKQVRSDQVGAIAQAEEEHKRVEAMKRLYLIQSLYQSERYQACQASIDEFEASGLVESLPSEAMASGVVSPLDAYSRVKEANLARMAEALYTPTTEEN